VIGMFILSDQFAVEVELGLSRGTLAGLEVGLPVGSK